LIKFFLKNSFLFSYFLSLYFLFLLPILSHSLPHHGRILALSYPSSIFHLLSPPLAPGVAMEPRPPISSQLKPRKMHQHHHATLTELSQEHQAQDVSTSQVVLTGSKECSANKMQYDQLGGRFSSYGWFGSLSGWGKLLRLEGFFICGGVGFCGYCLDLWLKIF